MHEVTEPTTAPPPKSESRRSYVDLEANHGRFAFRNAKDAPVTHAQTLMGFYRAHWLEWDHGRPSANPKDHVPARFNVRILLARAKTAEGEVLGDAIVTVSAPVPFSSIAEQLLQVDAGTYVSFAAVLAKNSSFVDTATWDGTEWRYVYTPAAGGVPFDDRYRSCIERLKASWFYDEVESPKQPPEGAAWKARVLASAMDAALKARLDAARPPVDPPASGPPANPGPNAPAPEAASSAAGAAAAAPASAPATPTPTGTAPAAEAAPVQTSAPAAEDKAVAEVPAGKSVFGYVPGRWARPADLDASPTDAQNAAIRKKATERGLFEPQADTGLVTFEQAFLARDEIVRAYGLQVTRNGSLGTAMLVYDVLANGSAETIAALKTKLAPAPSAVPGSEEYDPFADA